MDPKSPRREPDAIALPPPTDREETDESRVPHDVSQCDLTSNIFFVYATPPQVEKQPSDSLPVEPINYGTLDNSVVWLSEGERWDGVNGTFMRIAKEEDGTAFLELGEVHQQCEKQDSLPMVPDSFANLDLARLTVWGWILLLISSFSVVFSAIVVGQMLGIEKVTPSMQWPVGMIGLSLCGALFILGRSALESRDVIVVRRSKAAKN